ncbi:JAB domain-containing protein [Saprospiraceae bacterium]|nr:JAB domain-containing protein [Saprospiraceae bacterium]
MKNKIAEIKIAYTSPIDKDIIKITTSEKAFDVLLQLWDQNILELQEEFKLLLLNRSNNVLGIYNMSKGGVSGTIVDLKIIFATALKCVASSIVLAHNHPSGNISPSSHDIELTKKIKEAGELLDIKVLDHIIVTKNGYYSFADHGML